MSNARDTANLLHTTLLPVDVTSPSINEVIKYDGTKWTNGVDSGGGMFADGTPLAPSISFINDTNTGLYLNNPDEIGVSTGGTYRIRISNNSSDLYHKARIVQTDTVGVTGAGASQQFEIYNAGNEGGSGACFMTFHRGGAYAINFGLDTDNVFKLGGFSAGTGVSQFTIDTSGNFTARGNVTAYSDVRLKTNIETIENPLETVSKLRGVTFTRIDDNSEGVGVIAQEIKEVLPQVVHEQDGKLSVAYGNIVGVLIEAIKELKQEVDELKQEVRELKK